MLLELVEPIDEIRTAPVSHQKRPQQRRTNAIEIKRYRSKINEAVRYPAAHNGLVAGSSPAGPPMITGVCSFLKVDDLVPAQLPPQD
jgi:hypothetical protein